ncbi:MAG: helix-turn-helix domain-containing protein, partial [Actinomycetota bacterium]
AGLALRTAIERRTDELCVTMWKAVGESTTRRFIDLVEPVGERLLRRIDDTAGPDWMPAARERRAG